MGARAPPSAETNSLPVPAAPLTAPAKPSAVSEAKNSTGRCGTFYTPCARPSACVHSVLPTLSYAGRQSVTVAHAAQCVPAPRAASESIQGDSAAETYGYWFRSRVQPTAQLQQLQLGQQLNADQRRRQELPAVGKGVVRRRRLAQQNPSASQAVVEALMALDAMVEVTTAPQSFMSTEADCEGLSATHSSTQLGCGHCHLMAATCPRCIT